MKTMNRLIGWLKAQDWYWNLYFRHGVQFGPRPNLRECSILCLDPDDIPMPSPGYHISHASAGGYKTIAEWEADLGNDKIYGDTPDTKLREVTIWKKWDNDRKFFAFNHLTSTKEPEGKNEPTPISEHQRKAWKGARWSRTDVFLNEKNQVVIL